VLLSGNYCRTKAINVLPPGTKVKGMLPPGKRRKAEVINVLLSRNAGGGSKGSVTIKAKVTGKILLLGQRLQ